MPTQVRPVGVFNEWGKLREVLVGDSSRCVFPRWSPDWGRYHGFKTMLHGLEGVPLQQAMPERAKGMIEQTEALVRVLEEHDVVVHRPRPLTDMEIAVSPVGLINQFVRDAQIVIGKHVIETNLRMMFRCKEHLAYEEFFRMRLSEDPCARHVRMPDTTPILTGETEDDFLNDPRPFIEGGDTFVLGKDILVGFSSLASSPAGADWLQRHLGPEGYRVHLVPLTPEWLHLDCMFAVIQEGLCTCKD
jgi:glycine amidinotransferase